MGKVLAAQAYEPEFLTLVPTSKLGTMVFSLIPVLGRQRQEDLQVHGLVMSQNQKSTFSI